MFRPIFLISLLLLSACMPQTGPLVTGRADNAMMRFSAADLAPLMKPDKR